MTIPTSNGEQAEQGRDWKANRASRSKRRYKPANERQPADDREWKSRASKRSNKGRQKDGRSGGHNSNEHDDDDNVLSEEEWSDEDSLDL